MKQQSSLMKALAAENKKITDALKAIGYETIKIGIPQIRSAETDGIDIQVWARSKEKS